MKVSIRCILIFTLSLSQLFNCTAQEQSFEEFMVAFVDAYDKLDIPDFRIDYKENLENIQPLDNVIYQEEVFMDMANKIRSIDRYVLSKQDRLSFELIRYQINLNVERIRLEKQWLADRPVAIPEGGVANLSIGHDWYRYLIHHWVDIQVEPEQLFEFGKSEVARVEARIQEIKHKSGLTDATFEQHINDPSFFYNSPQEVQQAFEAKKKQVATLLPSYFPFLQDVPDIAIKRYDVATNIQTPAFYRSNENTFYYNFFDKPFNKRQISWIYIHEANPGHHYQIQLAKDRDRSVIQERFGYSGFREGWAAYVEEIGTEIGAYEGIYDELGKYEWDLIRSVRVVMDVGMNFYGWTDEQAMEYWQEHIQGQDDIARREIKRMRNWPAQVITYKYGADKIVKWRSLLESKKDFVLKDFHRLVVENGDIPFSVLEPFILDEGLQILNNISYTDAENGEKDQLQKLNLVLPENEIKPPLLLWIGGGAWALLDRHREMTFSKRMAQEGIAVAAVGHRLSSAVFQDPLKTEGIKHPAHVEDIASAIRWLYDHAEEYGYDKEKIYVGGFSSGGHLAALISMDNRYLQSVGLDKSIIKGAIPISGTYDVLDYKDAFATGTRPQLVEQHVHAVFGDTKAEHLEASPTTYVNDMSVPMLLMSDANMIGYANVFEESILETDFHDIDFFYIRNMNHGELYHDLESNYESMYRDLIINFIR